MKLLADTHIVIWAAQEQHRLSPKTVKALASTQHVFVSAASVWEMRIKHQLGRLDLSAPPLAIALAMVQSDRSRLLTITCDHAAHHLNDPPATKDPFDQLLLAQCDLEGLRLVTADARLAAHRLAL